MGYPAEYQNNPIFTKLGSNQSIATVRTSGASKSLRTSLHRRNRSRYTLTVESNQFARMCLPACSPSFWSRIREYRCGCGPTSEFWMCSCHVPGHHTAMTYEHPLENLRNQGKPEFTVVARSARRHVSSRRRTAGGSSVLGHRTGTFAYTEDRNKISRACLHNLELGH